MKTAIVGNANLSAGDRLAISSFERIIRFNNPPPSHFHLGMRTDVLYLVNSSSQTQKMLSNQTFLDGPVFSATREIRLPFTPEHIDRFIPKPSFLRRLTGASNDHTGLCLEICRRYGKPVSFLPDEIHQLACQKLGINQGGREYYFPSTGFLGVLAEIHVRAATGELHLFGFSFEGWKHHNWEAERAFVLGQTGKGLVFHTAAE